MSSYSVKEASELIGISERMIQIKCKNDNVRKKDNKYLITDKIIEKWKEQTNEKETKSKRNLNEKEQLVSELKKKIKELEQGLKKYDIADDERIEVFTNDEYKLFEERLIQWREQRKELEHQEQLFKAEQKSNEEIINHYKEQYYYQKSQSEKILEMHQKLIEMIQSRALIEAIEKDIVDKDTWAKKKYE